MDIIGYADRWSVVPGETLTLHVSCAWPARYEADVVRLRGGPTTRDSDAVDETHVDTVIDGVHEGGPQATDCGSYALLPADPRLFDPNGFAIELLVWPTMPSKPRQILAAQAWKAAGFVLGLVDGRAMLRLGDGTELRAAAPLLGRRWYRLRARCDVGGDGVCRRPHAAAPAHVRRRSAHVTARRRPRRRTAAGKGGRAGCPLVRAAERRATRTGAAWTAGAAG